VSILSQMMEKPWATAQGGDVPLGDSEGLSMPMEKVGLLVFLSAITVLFTLLVIAYGGRMELGSDWRPLPDPWLLWPNTALLILSSVALQWARVCARRGQIGSAGVRLNIAGGLAFAFLAGQLLASYQLIGLGYFAASNPANAFFYLLTGLHGLHLFGGLVAWSRTSARIRLGVDAAKVALGIELCAIYWHFLLVVWCIIFILMLGT